MSNYSNLKTTIQATIKANGVGEITGPILQTDLLAMITELGRGYQFIGVASPSTNPGTPDAKVMYLAYMPGTYTNFGSIEVSGFCVLKYDTTWTKEDIPISGGGGGDANFLTEPDDLTLETIQDNKLLKFANRAYNSSIPNGLGYKILRGNASFASQVNAENTIYVIRYNFDLGGNTINLPSNIVLRFDGGTLKNGSIVGDHTIIEAGDCQIFDGINFGGNFIGDLNAVWVGAKTGDIAYNNGVILQAWLSGYCSSFPKLFFPTGVYNFTTGSLLSTDTRNLVLDGGNSTFNINIPTDDEYFLSLSNPTTSQSSGENFLLENVRLVNKRETNGVHLSKTRGLFLNRAQRFNIQNVQFFYFDIAVMLKDCWYGGFGGLTFFYQNRVGIKAIRGTSYELNTIEIHNVDFSGAPRENIQAVYPQESGESADAYLLRVGGCAFDSYTLLQGVTLRGCVFEGHDYAVRANWSRFSSSNIVNGGGFTLDGCYFEKNRIEDLYTGPGNYLQDGSGSSQIRYNHNVTLIGCRFNTLRHITICGGHYVFLNNEQKTLQILYSDYVATAVDYNDPTTFGGVAANAAINKIGDIEFTKLYQTNGAQSAAYASIKAIQYSRSVNRIRSRLSSYAYDLTTPGNNEFVVSPWSYQTEPSVKYALDVHPLSLHYDRRNSYARLLVPSGESYMPVQVDLTWNFQTLNCNDGIPLYEFIRRWKAGISYTGIVQNLFPYAVTANPTAGTITNSSGTLVGFGSNGIGSITIPTNSYLVYVDALVVMRQSYSAYKFYADLLQCGRTYMELSRGVDTANQEYRFLIGTATQMNSVQKRVNAIFYDTTNSKLMIYDGFQWVEMTSPFQRYYYKSYGKKIAERASVPDMVGQTFHNTATGITYTFTFGGGDYARSPKWISGIGLVASLDHPNGYTYDNTLSYATELQAGEQVVCNGRLYTWDGSAFKVPNSGTTAQRPSLASVDAGYQYYDKTLSKYICWSGSAWTNLDGSSL